jgi:hypothetical protein
LFEIALYRHEISFTIIPRIVDGVQLPPRTLGVRGES